MDAPTAATADTDVLDTPQEDPTVHILWINAGLSCDGDSVSLTAATQPSIEELALGALPGLPKVAVHRPLIDYACGPVQGADNFVEWFFKADRGELEPFVLVVEGSIPNERIKPEGYWCGFGDDPETGQPITTSEWLDRLTPKALAVSPSAPAPPTAASTPWPATRPEPWACRTTSAGSGRSRPGLPLLRLHPGGRRRALRRRPGGAGAR